jgi:hypothetical protein
MRKQSWSLLAVGLVLWGVPALAQRSSGSIRGTVTDPAHLVVVGCKVTVTGEDTGFTRSALTNSAGAYSFPDLPVGTYRVDVEGPQGFKGASLKKIVLNVTDVREVNVQLQAGYVSEEVSVEANAIQVQTVGGDLSGLITGEQVRELPLNGRNFLQLATLMPGVSAPDFLNVKDKGLLGGSDLSVSGSSVTGNMWTVDGANNNDVGSNRTILVYPSVDAIEEFKIHRNSYGAEFGGASGAQINIVTRSGTNEFHGSGFYFGRRDALDAKNYFLQLADQPKDHLNRNDFGWTFGGPIIKDKLHFFASQEWNRELRGSVRSAFVPTAQERGGDFSGPQVAGCSSPAPIDPLTGLPFPGNVIPSGRLSPAGLLFLQLYPLPNTTPTAGTCNNWVASLDSPINWRQENARIDWDLNNTTRLMVRYTQDHWENNAPDLNTNLWGDSPFPAVNNNWSQPGHSVVVQLTKNIGSRAVNSLEFTYSSNSITVTRGGTNPGLNDQVNAAIPSLFPENIKEYPGTRGVAIFFGGQGYGTTVQEMAPFKNNQDLFVLKDDYNAVFGKHNVKVGASGSYNKKNEDVFDQGSSESPQFWGSTGLNNTGVTTGNLLADFLLKDMTFGFTENSAERSVPQRWVDLEFYAADSWKIHPRVTVDYGVRYSRFNNPYSADDKIGSFVPQYFNPALGGDPCNGVLYPPGTNPCQPLGLLGGSAGPNRSLTLEDNKMIAPRVGIAWDVKGNGTTSVRLGVGQFFLRERLSPGLDIGANPPFVTTITGIRFLDSAAPPCSGCFSSSFGAPNAGRELKALNPNNWQWNLTLEQQLVKDTTLELSYVGSKGNHLLRTYDPNQVPAGDPNGDGVPDRLEYFQSGATPNGALRPYGAFGDHKITFWDHGGTSIYHSLQTQLLSRFWGGSQFEASYTFSKSVGDVSLDDSNGSLSADESLLDVSRPRLDRGLTRTNRTHVFNASLVLELPSLSGKSGFVKNAFGSWEVATIAQYSTGTPITFHTGPMPGLTGPSGTGYTDNQRPNVVPGQACRATGGPPEQWINPNVVTLNGFLLGSDGTSGRGQCDGPDFFQVDLALYKNFPLSKSVKLQFRFEVFNVFNRNNFISVNNILGPTSVTYDTGNPATATRIVNSVVPASFGQATATRDARQAQFGLKLVF